MLWALSWEIWEVKPPTDFLSTGLALRFEQGRLSMLCKSQEHLKSHILKIRNISFELGNIKGF